MTTDAAPTTVPLPARGRRAVWIGAAGLITNTLALVAWAIGGPLPPGQPAQTVIFIVAVFLQFAAVSMLLAASVIGVTLLLRRTRPRVWPLLAALAFPLAVVLTVPKLFVFWLFSG